MSDPTKPHVLRRRGSADEWSADLVERVAKVTLRNGSSIAFRATTPNPWLARTEQLVRRVKRHSTGKRPRRNRVIRVRP